jgi:tetratricopeptide (TPR) repeat protein
VDAAQKAVAYQNSSFAIETLARCYAAAGNYQQAAQQYETVLTRASERSSAAFDNPAFRRVVLAHYQLGVLYQKVGRPSDSRSHLEKFLAIGRKLTLIWICTKRSASAAACPGRHRRQRGKWRLANAVDSEIFS